MKKLCMFLLLVVSACVTKPDDVSILGKSNCKLPCWNNIVVGHTTQDEFIQFLETSTDIDQKSIRNDNHPWSIFDNHIYFSFQRTEIDVNAHTSNNIISDLLICGKLDMTIGDIVEEIGEPEYIISGNGLDGNRNVIMINPPIGASYWYTTDPSLGELKYEINSDIEIECLDLFDPSIYEEMMEAGLFSMGHYNAEETMRVWYPWDGYGNLNEKYPPRRP